MVRIIRIYTTRRNVTGAVLEHADGTRFARFLGANLDEAGAEAKVAALWPTSVLVTSDGESLSNSGYHRSGKSRWWLRNDVTGTFADVPSVRGDREFECRLDLEPGNYTLGTGKRNDAIRILVTVGDVAAQGVEIDDVRDAEYALEDAGVSVWTKYGARVYDNSGDAHDRRRRGYVDLDSLAAAMLRGERVEVGDYVVGGAISDAMTLRIERALALA